jgi:hypothetical protein
MRKPRFVERTLGLKRLEVGVCDRARPSKPGMGFHEYCTSLAPTSTDTTVCARELVGPRCDEDTGANCFFSRCVVLGQQPRDNFLQDCKLSSTETFRGGGELRTYTYQVTASRVVSIVFVVLAFVAMVGLAVFVGFGHIRVMRAEALTLYDEAQRQRNSATRAAKRKPATTRLIGASV